MAKQYERRQREAARQIEENKRMVEEMAKKELELLQKLQVTTKIKDDILTNFKRKQQSVDKPQSTHSGILNKSPSGDGNLSYTNERD